MGKNYCKVGHKWCKLCSHGMCGYGNRKTDIKTIKDCLKRSDERTVSFKELLQRTSFGEVMTAMGRYWPDQVRNIDGYRNVYHTMLERRSQQINGFTIHGNIEVYDDGECPVMSARKGKQYYACDGFKWAEINYMNVDKETLERMEAPDIICGVLYEMTFNGYTEDVIDEFFKNLQNNFEEMKHAEGFDIAV